jgi:hypothetical protein
MLCHMSYHASLYRLLCVMFFMLTPQLDISGPIGNICLVIQHEDIMKSHMCIQK